MHIQVENQLNNAIVGYLGINDYVWLVDNVNKTNISEDVDGYQHVFNRFYRVRRDKNWQKAYYGFFENNKKKKIEFSYIIKSLKGVDLGIVPSFSSKMLATINTQYPIWDGNVLEKLGFTHRWEQDKSIDNAIAIYDDICKWYTDYLKSSDARESILTFDSRLPEYKNISNVKKIDYLLWIK